MHGAMHLHVLQLHALPSFKLRQPNSYHIARTPDRIRIRLEVLFCTLPQSAMLLLS